MAWHISGVVAVIALILRQGATLTGTSAVFVLLSLLLYAAWYRHLQSPEAGRQEAEEDTLSLK